MPLRTCAQQRLAVDARRDPRRSRRRTLSASNAGGRRARRNVAVLPGRIDRLAAGLEAETWQCCVCLCSAVVSLVLTTSVKATGAAFPRWRRAKMVAKLPIVIEDERQSAGPSRAHAPKEWACRGAGDCAGRQDETPPSPTAAGNSDRLGLQDGRRTRRPGVTLQWCRERRLRSTRPCRDAVILSGGLSSLHGTR